MARPKRWKYDSYDLGTEEVELSSWGYFGDFIKQEFLNYNTYVYRGQADATWGLLSTLDREFRRVGLRHSHASQRRHLQNFISAARGRRGYNPRSIADEDEWWALGQHNGLKTPLLDFTESPFVALYFSFLEPSNARTRAIYALSEPFVTITARSLEIEYEQKLRESGHTTPSGETARSELGEPRAPVPPPKLANVVRPQSDENVRLVSQRGLFVRTPVGMSLEDWIKANTDPGSSSVSLLKIRIPNKGREECLRFLNRMNINHLSLFPDLYGASIHCNNDLAIRRY